MRRFDETLDLNEIEFRLNSYLVEGTGRRGEIVRILYDESVGHGGKVTITLYGTAPPIPTLTKWASQEMDRNYMFFDGMLRRDDGTVLVLKYGTFLSYPAGFGTTPVTFSFSFEVIEENA